MIQGPQKPFLTGMHFMYRVQNQLSITSPIITARAVTALVVAANVRGQNPYPKAAVFSAIYTNPAY